jgi:drug/metabolite transporter (DMT)-like permease
LPADRSKTASGATPFLLGSAVLGTIGVFLANAHADPMTATWFRCAFGLMGLTAWVLARGHGRCLWLSASSAPWILSAGVLMVTAWALFFFAIEHTSTGVAVVLFHVQPLWVLLLGSWWLKEAMGGRRLTLVLVAMAGLLLATGVVEHTSLTGPGKNMPVAYWLGIAACLIGAFMTALITLIAKRMGGLPSGIFAWWQCAIGTVILLLWPIQHGWPAFGASWGWLAGLGLIHTGIAYTLIYAGTPRLSTGRIAVFQFVYPAVAIVIDWLYFGDRLSGYQLLGIAIMSVAIWIAERPVRK